MNNSLIHMARRLRMGRLLYHTYYAPMGLLRRCRREGLGNLWLSHRGRALMETATARLPPIKTTGRPALEIHFLTGRKFWYQTCFCAFSMLRHSPVAIRPLLYDDGSLNRQCTDTLRGIIPNIQIVPRNEIEQRLERALPPDRYPSLRSRRLVYPHLRKLTDVHAGSRGWKLVLDSDMLFFREPTLLLDWLDAPDRPCYMLDIESSYGYSTELMAELAGAPIAERLNVGVCGLRSEAIDWDQLEFWCRTLIERAGPHYYQEQALTAMLLAGQSCRVAPREEYIALPSRQEVLRPRGVMHHYVAESKAWYFRHAWRQIVSGCCALPG